MGTTPYFAAGWYRATYPAVEAEILSGAVENALHHYLVNETPADFDPNPIFSESVYLRRNDDVAQAVTERRVRSGYHHFIADGVRENRSSAGRSICRNIRRRMPSWAPT